MCGNFDKVHILLKNALANLLNEPYSKINKIVIPFRTGAGYVILIPKLQVTPDIFW